MKYRKLSRGAASAILDFCEHRQIAVDVLNIGDCLVDDETEPDIGMSEESWETCREVIS
jgi:hypothetical protein